MTTYKVGERVWCAVCGIETTDPDVASDATALVCDAYCRGRYDESRGLRPEHWQHQAVPNDA